jgi:hypothetical protein
LVQIIEPLIEPPIISDEQMYVFMQEMTKYIGSPETTEYATAIEWLETIVSYLSIAEEEFLVAEDYTVEIFFNKYVIPVPDDVFNEQVTKEDFINFIEKWIGYTGT